MPILAVRMNRKRVVLVFNKEINVYDLANMKLLDTIATATNPQGWGPPPCCSLDQSRSHPTFYRNATVSAPGICALSPDSSLAWLVYPGAAPGEVVLYDSTHGVAQGGCHIASA